MDLIEGNKIGPNFRVEVAPLQVGCGLAQHDRNAWFPRISRKTRQSLRTPEKIGVDEVIPLYPPGVAPLDVGRLVPQFDLPAIEAGRSPLSHAVFPRWTLLAWWPISARGTVLAGRPVLSRRSIFSWLAVLACRSSGTR